VVNEVVCVGEREKERERESEYLLTGSRTILITGAQYVLSAWPTFMKARPSRPI
jgi:hypothetical protein